MSSSVPFAVPAFKTLATGALPLGSQIATGSVLPAFQANTGNVNAIGSAITLQIEGVHFNEDEFAELGPTYRHEEHYNIQCCLYAWAGDADYDQRLQDAYLAYDPLSVAVANAPELNLSNNGTFAGGSWFRLAWTRQLDLTLVPSAQGFSTAQLTFEVQCQARVASLS
jgi:hypothetical protein